MSEESGCGCFVVVLLVAFILGYIADSEESRSLENEESLSMLEKYGHRLKMDRDGRDGFKTVEARMLMYKELDMKYGPGKYTVVYKMKNGWLYYKVHACGMEKTEN